ncbi:uncharacterized protein MELLADRAFT_104821 [Melampsora larici-populina 98AG31]|uniref:CCHC-type domain-containing protein n=1 Tax=Melampsora larici-populina (strain 98AG31 / pathotype 3-4-7) TaxID=747676 RepID=F4RGA6_MELLP|nr:uncharacterized protein MELLADRAFT_104821 [Melampsora larici-populina 98AG31]EGG08440.1 hypothetical protein MELLADRAFT_104821 [Melampsora larici-populina 98AG31]
MPATPMSTPINVHSSSNPVTLTPELHITTIPLTLDAARSILELTMSTRSSSNQTPVSIPLTAYPKILLAIDQCYQCGIFGHREWECAEKGLPRRAEAVADWRRTTNGKIYSLKALLGMPPYQKWTLASLSETLSKHHMYDSPSATPTPAISGRMKKMEVETIVIDTPSPTPAPAPVASTSSLTMETMGGTSGRSKATTSSNKGNNSKVTPWGEWSKDWSWRPLFDEIPSAVP